MIELAGIYCLILIVMWTPRPWQWPMWVIAFIATAYVIALSYDGLRSMGLCTYNLARSLWAVGLSLLVGVAAVALAIHMHTLHMPGNPTTAMRHFGLYVLWATLQQLMLQYFFLTRSLRLLSNATSAAVLTAGLFAFAHLPNPLLTVITLVCGLAACFFFLHYRNLWPLAVAHAILGIAIAITIPSSLDHNMSVGIGYFTYGHRSVLSQTAMSAKP